MNEEQFLRLSLPLGVDHVRRGGAADARTVYVFMNHDGKDEHPTIMRMAKKVWPDESIVIVAILPSAPPDANR